MVDIRHEVRVSDLIMSLRELDGDLLLTPNDVYNLVIIRGDYYTGEVLGMIDLLHVARGEVIWFDKE